MPKMPDEAAENIDFNDPEATNIRSDFVTVMSVMRADPDGTEALSVGIAQWGDQVPENVRIFHVFDEEGLELFIGSLIELHNRITTGEAMREIIIAGGLETDAESES